MTRPAAPKGLGTAGSRLWRSVLDAFELSEQGLTLLRQASRTADLCDQLQAVVDVEGPMVSAKDDGQRAHPALVELRQQRITLARLLVALRVPIGDDDDAVRTQRRGIRGVYGGRGAA
ncbi:hypothetical protein [Micromonospora sp. U21]|uniref:hypothetical protein n=1 Tax=Micromonospora sp. U21 TaxID=2824899 RepID=UPI001B365D30|nr:hypothetical protein [Micromonospora sp. U21]MBQ0902680.1 hypothetical protein [Micromonospora sp. U21]